MRADQWLMLSVVGLGVYAVYRLSKASGEAGDEGGAEEKPERLEQILLPEQAGKIVLPENGPVFVATPDGTSIRLSNSRAYLGRGEDLTEDSLASLGLEAIRVWDDPRRAKAAGFPAFSLANPGKRTRWFYGRYLLPTVSAPRKLYDGSEIGYMWIVRGPTVVSGAPSPWVHRREVFL